MGCVLNPHVADVGRSDGGDVPADGLFRHVVRQAGAACTGGGRRPPTDPKRAKGFGYRWT